MAWFKCFIRGENFPVQLDGQLCEIGFYVTRFVEASNASAAETSALEGLRGDPKLGPPPGGAHSGQSRVFFENIEESRADEVPAVQPGFVFFKLDDASA